MNNYARVTEAADILMNNRDVSGKATDRDMLAMGVGMIVANAYLAGEQGGPDTTPEHIAIWAMQLLDRVVVDAKEKGREL